MPDFSETRKRNDQVDDWLFIVDPLYRDAALRALISRDTLLADDECNRMCNEAYGKLDPFGRTHKFVCALKRSLAHWQRHTKGALIKLPLGMHWWQNRNAEWVWRMRQRFDRLGLLYRTDKELSYVFWFYLNECGYRRTPAINNLFGEKRGLEFADNTVKELTKRLVAKYGKAARLVDQSNEMAESWLARQAETAALATKLFGAPWPRNASQNAKNAQAVSECRERKKVAGEAPEPDKRTSRYRGKKWNKESTEKPSTERVNAFRYRNSGNLEMKKTSNEQAAERNRRARRRKKFRREAPTEIGAFVAAYRCAMQPEADPEMRTAYEEMREERDAEVMAFFDAEDRREEAEEEARFKAIREAAAVARKTFPNCNVAEQPGVVLRDVGVEDLDMLISEMEISGSHSGSAEGVAA